MNKIVFHDYASSKLPQDLHAAAGEAELVTLTIERPEPRPMRTAEFFARLQQFRQTLRPEDMVSQEEAVARIRQLRDEWDD